MGRKKKTPVPQIPENILNNLNEHCAHGWMLFSYDFEGSLRLHCNFDNVMAMKSLRHDVNNWVEAMKNLENHVTMQKLLENSGEK